MLISGTVITYSKSLKKLLLYRLLKLMLKYSHLWSHRVHLWEIKYKKSNTVT